MCIDRECTCWMFSLLILLSMAIWWMALTRMICDVAQIHTYKTYTIRNTIPYAHRSIYNTHKYIIEFSQTDVLFKTNMNCSFSDLSHLKWNSCFNDEKALRDPMLLYSNTIVHADAPTNQNQIRLKTETK